MSTHVQGFQLFFRFLNCIIHVSSKLVTNSKRGKFFTNTIVKLMSSKDNHFTIVISINGVIH